jgi:uncharacterized protein YcbX
MVVFPRGTEVGRVVALWRYPVKSMGAEQLAEADVSWNGLAGDRRWAFIRAGVVGSGFPWLTLRECPQMNAYRPSFVDPTRPDSSQTVVCTPSGSVFNVADGMLAAELGAGVQVIKQNRGVFDTMPLSLVTTQTIDGLGKLVDAKLEVQRFRPNFLVEARGEAAFPEDGWVGHVLRVGGLRMRVDKRDQRCVIVNLDPITAERNSSVLRAIGRERTACLGVYGSTVEPGRVMVGDPVLLDG